MQTRPFKVTGIVVAEQVVQMEDHFYFPATENDHKFTVNPSIQTIAQLPTQFEPALEKEYDREFTGYSYLASLEIKFLDNKKENIPGNSSQIYEYGIQKATGHTKEFFEYLGYKPFQIDGNNWTIHVWNEEDNVLNMLELFRDINNKNSEKQQPKLLPLKSKNPISPNRRRTIK